MSEAVVWHHQMVEAWETGQKGWVRILALPVTP